MAAILQPPVLETGAPPHKRFTRVEVERMLETDIFAGQRFELIDGELIDKRGQNPPHFYGIRVLNRWLLSIFGPDLVQVQGPVQAAGPDHDWSVPEPDLAVLAELKDDYRRRHPRGDELILAVEVADTTIRWDLTRKRDLYARAGVAEYWVLDVNQRRLIVHRNLINGAFQQISTLSETDSISISGRPETILISQLLP
jgi:Uma2 family endonuclease